MFDYIIVVHDELFDPDFSFQWDDGEIWSKCFFCMFLFNWMFIVCQVLGRSGYVVWLIAGIEDNFKFIYHLESRWRNSQCSGLSWLFTKPPFVTYTIYLHHSVPSPSGLLTALPKLFGTSSSYLMMINVWLYMLGVFPWTPNSEHPSHKLPIPFPYFKGWLLRVPRRSWCWHPRSLTGRSWKMMVGRRSFND